MFFEKKKIPLSNEMKEVDVTALWAVRWKSVNDTCLQGSKEEAEFFLNEQDAKDFKQSLEQAMSLLKQSVQKRVSIKKAEH